jgi:two-component system, chemotaxis family, protein-glutamate methylesterase/glutaminase
MAFKEIRVLVVDDSLFMREFISKEISKDTGITVVGKASDPYEARDRITDLAPDVMTLDIQMPRMNGIEFLKLLMPQYPLPVVVVSAVDGAVFDAMNAGAVDFINKSNMKDERDRQRFISELIMKIKIASIAKVGKYKHSEERKTSLLRTVGRIEGDTVIAIGASTGGTEAISTIIKGLGRDLPGIVIVQHMPPVFTKLYADRLNNSCAMEVIESKNGDEVKPGRAIIAQGGQQMYLNKKSTGLFVECREGEKVSGHCPSVDVLFDSASKIKGINSLGIILTGMGSDGAKGLLSMKKAGASTIGQNKQTCIVYGMPEVAYSIGAVDVQLALGDIPGQIYKWFNGKCRAKE